MFGRISTATETIQPDFRRNRFLQLVALLLLLAWVVAAISPVDRLDWLLENLLVFAAAIAAWLTYRRWPLSDLSYLLIGLFLVLHLAGSHYTYSKVPLGFWLQEWGGFQRNHFDRIVHFSFGLLIAYPVWEVLRRYSRATPLWCLFCAFAIMAAASDIFEIIEWLVASLVDPAAAEAYLGQQGDPFDAQKDVALAHLGTLLALAILVVSGAGRSPAPPQS